MSSQPKERPLRYIAYEAIRDKIIYLELRPGDRVSENEIAKSLGMGRTPVREALLLLERERLIEIKPGSGFSVCRFTREETEDYRLVRTAIEHLSLTLAIQRITPAEVEALNENLRNLRRHTEDGNIRNIVKYESEFHDIIYNSTRSPAIRETMSGLNTKFLWMRAVSLSIKGAAKECLGEHKQILKAIEKKDVEEAKRMVNLHLKRGWEKLHDVLWLFKEARFGDM
jgi:GntR family transcriptional regulator, rspAB operon transcriptional repressor